jgi:hypothetical protein
MLRPREEELMERRDFIKSAAAAVTAVVTPGAPGRAAKSAHASNPISRPMSHDMQYASWGVPGRKLR